MGYGAPQLLSARISVSDRCHHLHKLQRSNLTWLKGYVISDCHLIWCWGWGLCHISQVLIQAHSILWFRTSSLPKPNKRGQRFCRVLGFACCGRISFVLTTEKRINWFASKVLKGEFPKLMGTWLRDGLLSRTSPCYYDAKMAIVIFRKAFLIYNNIERVMSVCLWFDNIYCLSLT